MAVTGGLATRGALAQPAMESVAAIERERVLREAGRDVEPKDAIQFSARFAVLTSAFLLTKDEAYAARARDLLQAWLLTAETKLPTPAKLGVPGMVPLAEVAVGLRFLVDFLDAEVLTAVRAVFAEAQTYLQTDHDALLMRDASDHRGSAWLLESAAFARAMPDEKALEECRRWFKKPVLRKQIAADGTFPEELASTNPLRNTLLDFDLLTGACQLLSSSFENLWDFELQDGPGMRVVVAWLYPRLKDRAQWPAVADAQFFREVPLRRPGLLFAGRAYDRPEYVELWKSEPATVPAGLAAIVPSVLPIREPLLWTTRAMHGL
jgi:hypothetical protein